MPLRSTPFAGVAKPTPMNEKTNKVDTGTIQRPKKSMEDAQVLH